MSYRPPAPRRLAARILVEGVVFQLVLGALLLGAAGTWRFWQAWAYVGVFLVGTTGTNVYLIRHDPALLERRMRRGVKDEVDPAQKLFQALAGPLFFALLVVAGLDHRFGWSRVAAPLQLAALALVGAGSFIIYLVFRENSYASRVVAIEAAQKVIATGPYRLVRHPMYAAVLLAGAASPVALGSWWAELLLAPVAGLMVVRLLREERLLRASLPGYAEYVRATRYRLVPGAW